MNEFALLLLNVIALNVLLYDFISAIANLKKYVVSNKAKELLSILTARVLVFLRRSSQRFTV